jgi:hypothetical protein
MQSDLRSAQRTAARSRASSNTNNAAAAGASQGGSATTSPPNHRHCHVWFCRRCHCSWQPSRPARHHRRPCRRLRFLFLRLGRPSEGDGRRHEAPPGPPRQRIQIRRQRSGRSLVLWLWHRKLLHLHFLFRRRHGCYWVRWRRYLTSPHAGRLHFRRSQRRLRGAGRTR